MSHDNHTTSNENSFLNGMEPQEAIDYYLNLAGDWVDPYGPPTIERYEGVNVVADHLITGSKCRGGDLLISRAPSDHIVYVQPRCGLAGVSLVEVCKRHGKKLTLFMPSSKKISYHQACCVERGADARFVRIAAMPNANRLAKLWAEENGAYFVSFGLKSELVVAGLVKSALTVPEPEVVWSVASTAVLTRSLQIAWNSAEFHAVAVARNLQEGERGRAEIISAPEPFLKPVKTSELPPFPTVASYDAKGYRYVPKHSKKDVLFWNVGAEPTLLDETIYDKVDSYREWGDNRDLQQNNHPTVESHERLGASLVGQP
jgi:hypothetical protein